MFGKDYCLPVDAERR